MARLALLVVLALAVAAQAHTRWTCPKPRDPSTGIKVSRAVVFLSFFFTTFP